MKEANTALGTLDRPKGRKFDWIIYILAIISCALMIFVIVHKNNTNKIFKAEKDVTVIETKKTVEIKEKEIPIEKKETMAIPEKEKIEEKLLVEKEVIDKKSEKTATEKIVAKEKEIPDKKIMVKKEVKDIKKIKEKAEPYSKEKYNWKVLSRYKVKPNKNLNVVTQYKVKSGDALWKIASKMKVKTINIIAVNNMNNPDHIVPGQVINIPNM